LPGSRGPGRLESYGDYAPSPALEAAATPTSNPMSTKTSAIVVALDTTAAETTAMKPSVARIKIMAIAITYPSIGRTVSRSPILS